MSKGIDVRATVSELLFRVLLQDAGGVIVATGTTSLRLYEVQMADGTLKSYDFNDNTFKTTALTTPTLAMTHRTGNNATYNTGLWTARLPSLGDFTVGNIYLAHVSNAGASPAVQVREFQFGSAQGDEVPITAYVAQTGDSYDRIGANGAGLTALGDVRLANLDATVASRMATFIYTAPDNATITAIAGYLDTEIAVIKLKTDFLPADTAAVLALLATQAKVLSYVRSLARSDFAEDPDIGGTYDAAADSLEAIRGAVSASVTVFPAGAVPFTYTVTDSVSLLPIEGVEVWFATDLAGSNIVWKGDTDAFGLARDVNGELPNLDAGTYYVFRQKAGYIFVDPDTEVVS